MVNIMEQTKNISRKSKYTLLKEYGYTAKEADKLRGSGRKKFSELLYNSPKFKKASFNEQIRLNNQISGILSKTGLQGVKIYDKKLSPFKNQRTRIVYLIKIIFKDGEELYISYPTERILSIKEIEEEVQEYVENILEFNETYEHTFKEIKQIVVEGYRKE